MAGKKATVNNSDSRRESEEEEASEEESPRKIEPVERRYEQVRTARLNYGQPSYMDLNEQLSNMKEDEKKELAGRFTAYRARIARNEDTSVVHSTTHSKITGGKCTHTGCIMDSGYCTFPITSTAVAKVLGAEIKPLTRSLEIIDA